MRCEPLLLATALALTTACASRFAGITSGTYLCTPEVALNTCGIPISAMAQETELTGGGTDLLQLDLPGAVGREGFTNAPWQSIQLGAQASPFEYSLSGTEGCGMSRFDFAQRSSVTRLADDAIDFDHRFTFEGVSPCGLPVDRCEVRYTVRCVRL